MRFVINHSIAGPNASMGKSRKSKPSHEDTENLKTSDPMSSSSVGDLASIHNNAGRTSPVFQMHLFTMNQDRDGHAPEICSRTSAIVYPRVYVPVGMFVFNDRMHSCKGMWGGFACGAS